MEKHIRLLICLLSFSVLMAGCGDDIDEAGNAGDDETTRISDVSVYDVTSYTAIIDGRITGPATETGVCYAADADPTIESSKVSLQVKDFACPLEGLEPDTEYRVRIYAVNGDDVIYSDAASFSTTPLGVPSVISMQVVKVNPEGASFRAVVNVEGEVEISERGFCVSKEREPTVDDIKVPAEGTSQGIMNTLTDALEVETAYIARGYVIYNGDEVAYGSVIEFSTPGLIMLYDLYNTSSHRTFAKAELLAEAWKDGSSWTEIGLCWSTDQEPTTDDARHGYADPFVSAYGKMTTLAMKAETTYYIRAFVTDGTDTYYSNQLECTTMSPLLGTNAAFSNEMIPYDEEKGWIYNCFYYSHITPDDEMIEYGAGRTSMQKDMYQSFITGMTNNGGRQLRTLGFGLINDSAGDDVFAFRVTYTSATGGGNYVAHLCLHVDVDADGMFTVSDFTHENTNNNAKNLYNNFNNNGDVDRIMAFVDYLQDAPFFIDYIIEDIGNEKSIPGFMLMSTQAESDTDYFSLAALRISVTGSAIPQPW